MGLWESPALPGLWREQAMALPEAVRVQALKDLRYRVWISTGHQLWLPTFVNTQVKKAEKVWLMGGIFLCGPVGELCLHSHLPVFWDPRKTREHDPSSARFPWAAPPPPHFSGFCRHR